MHERARIAGFSLLVLLFTFANAPAQTTGTFGNCDPVIHDQLVGAEWRSPSECELKFDAWVRPRLTAALEPVVDSLTAHGWSVTRKVELQSLTAIPRHTEARPFELTEQQLHQGGAFFVQLDIDKSSPAFQQYDQPLQAAMQKFGAALKQMNAAEMTSAQNAMHDAAKAEEEHTTIAISVVINSSAVDIPNFKGGHTVTRLSSGGFAVSAPNVQPPTGGDESAAQRVIYVFLGPFTPPAPAGPTTGDETIHVRGGPLSAASAKLLSVQNVVLRIQTGTELAQQVIQSIDWTALDNLLAGK
ncbi:MAG TPA: hypothetical protein VG225_04795 [Terracidiphilus sp.]|jgi:hypothetical protein|nr:hypothetical protein [Terracidiphilus sp.]